ncbi:MAG: peptidylprolyl isomerase [Arcobacter sp.]|uniref:peptidylprolyl isomerase n=1 Tax=uncultured Arcobacter sp. TaxID=165434 RepID=UPI000CC83A66|nr:peptidylprolyl isomerase [uncultured Arcobacter sp.]PLY09414.1 MAG: peptidylprolyl isomerase [Arcobacter sp.]
MKKLFMLAIMSVLLYATNPIAVVETTQGKIEIELRPDMAPLAVENFTTLAKNGYYDNLIFHRIIKNFMIQGGDPTGTGRGGKSIWEKPFKDEFSPNAVFDKPGILAMANSGPNTNGSQFFITTVPTYWLNGRHTIFGYVKSGMDVVKKLENVPVSGQSQGNKPLIDQKIISIEIK